MSEPVTHKLDYSELERLYAEAAKACTCQHADATVSVSETGVYCLKCPACGFTGWANDTSARRLGWINA